MVCAQGNSPLQGLVNSGILDRELVAHVSLVDSAEPLDDVQAVARDVRPLEEVGGVDHQRVALPVPDRIAAQRPDLRRQVLRVQRITRAQCIHLDQDHTWVSVWVMRLEVVVEDRLRRQRRHAHVEAAVEQRQRLGAVVGADLLGRATRRPCCSRRSSGLSLARRALPSSVIGGTRPSGGSLMIDARYLPSSE